MSITAASQTAAADTVSANNEVARKSLAGTYDTFLKLLTTQLKHQDPLSPMETGEFTSQLVQFAGVEQQISVNDNLKQLLDLQKSSRMATAVGYLGSEVWVPGSAVPLQGGQAEFSYELPASAQATVVTITDAQGQVVRSFEGQTQAGRHAVAWDGTDADGTQLEDGAYRIDVLAVDPDTGKAMAGVKSWVTGKVTGVATDDTGGVTLSLGAVDVSLDEVREFRLAGN